MICIYTIYIEYINIYNMLHIRTYKCNTYFDTPCSRTQVHTCTICYMRITYIHTSIHVIFIIYVYLYYATLCAHTRSAYAKYRLHTYCIHAHVHICNKYYICITYMHIHIQHHKLMRYARTHRCIQVWVGYD